MLASKEPWLPRLRRVEERFTSRHGHTLCSHRWVPDPSASPTLQPPAPVCALLMSHGYSNYCGSFFDWKATVLASYGVAVYAIDHYAHGKSDGLPAFIPDFTVLVDDLEDYARHVRATHLPPGLRLFSYGESMGGAVVLQVARRDASLFQGLLLMAPMAGFDDAEMPHWLVQLAGRLLAAVVPWAPITPTRDIQAACFKDPERYAEVGLDPHRYAGRLRLATALQFKAATAEIQAGLGELTTPFLILHGTADVVTSPSVSRALFHAARSADKTLLQYAEGMHVLWWETSATRGDVLAQMVGWMHARAPAAVAGGLASPPTLPVALLQDRQPLPGPFRVGLDHPLTPWTFKSHGRAGVSVDVAPGAPASVSDQPEGGDLEAEEECTQ